MYGGSALMQVLKDNIKKVSPLNAPVLILGESGTGKELAARAVHENSRYKDGPFVPVNCGALSPAMVEDIFFGHAKGAFTGAAATHKGLFEQADGGTLFLDEIGELPLLHQASLLRVLENRTVKKIGSERMQSVNFRLITATNRDLLKMVDDKTFRLDLFHRICTLELKVPSLQNRKEDLPGLCSYFLHAMRSEMGVKQLDSGALEKIEAYTWPGNIRELKNVLYRAAAMTTGRIIYREALAINYKPRPALKALDDSEIIAVLQQSDGNISKAARKLNIPRTTLRNRLNSLK
jgi:two-component system response regulator HydG